MGFNPPCSKEATKRCSQGDTDDFKWNVVNSIAFCFPEFLLSHWKEWFLFSCRVPWNSLLSPSLCGPLRSKARWWGLKRLMLAFLTFLCAEISTRADANLGPQHQSMATFRQPVPLPTLRRPRIPPRLMLWPLRRGPTHRAPSRSRPSMLRHSTSAVALLSLATGSPRLLIHPLPPCDRPQACLPDEITPVRRPRRITSSPQPDPAQQGKECWEGVEVWLAGAVEV